MAGAAVAGLAASRAVAAPVHLAAVGATCGLAGLVATQRLPGGDREAAAGPRLVLHRPSRRVLLLGLIGFCSLFTEGAAADWSAVYLRTLGADEATAAAAFGAFSLAMAGGRLWGDRLVAALGPVRLLRSAAGVGAGGLALALGLPGPATGLMGFALLGAGVACVVPLVFSAAAGADSNGGQAIATVATISYLGWLLAPPTIGAVADQTSVGAALGLAVAATAAVVVLGGVLHRPE